MNFSFAAKNKSGFSLIEIALAMLVVAIGIPALLGLLGSGLNMNKSSQDDTVLGTFAQSYFNAVRAEARTNWTGVANASATVEALTANALNNPPDFQLTGSLNSYQLKKSGSNGIELYTLRYTPSIASSGNIIGLNLEVYPGAYGTNDVVTFYTEIYRLN